MFNSIVEAIHCHLENTPDKLCVADTNKAYTYKQFFNYVKQILFALIVKVLRCA